MKEKGPPPRLTPSLLSPPRRFRRTKGNVCLGEISAWRPRGGIPFPVEIKAYQPKKGAIPFKLHSVHSLERERNNKATRIVCSSHFTKKHLGMWFHEVRMQVKLEVVSNSRNKIHQNMYQDFSPSLYTSRDLDTVCLR